LKSVSGRLILGTSDLTLKAAVAGAGIAYVEARAAEPHLEAGEFVQLLADGRRFKINWTQTEPPSAVKRGGHGNSPEFKNGT
jgi:DNA-binding transcriptional LysR family regulator